MSKIYEVQDAAAVTARVTRLIAVMREQSRVVRIALEAMKKRDGKPVSKHLETAVKAALPDMAVSYGGVASLAYIYIWDGCMQDKALIPYNDRISLFLGHTGALSGGPLIYSDEKLRTDPGRAKNYLDGAEHADEMERRLPEIPELVARLNEARREYNAAVGGFAGLGYCALEARR